MGAVWEAHDTRLNRRVAVKVMVAGEDASANETERFKREAQNSAKLRHPNIVPVHDFGVERGRHYLVMDLVDGEMLGDALRQRQFTYREKAALLEKVARAVQYAHDQGVIHRDLKPSNVMLEVVGRTVGSPGEDGRTNSSPYNPDDLTDRPTYCGLTAIMQSLKGYTAWHANRTLGRSGQFWAHESFDHYVRDENELGRIIRYALNNPVKAGLAKRWQDWPWRYSRYGAAE